MKKDVAFIEVNGVKFYQYKAVFVTEDGHVYTGAMKELIPLADHSLWIKEKTIERNKDMSRKRKKYKVNRIVYEAISGDEVDSSHRVINIDGNLDNYAYSNLKKVSIKELANKKDYSSQYKIKEEDREEIRNSEETDKALAEKYGCSIVTIRKIRANTVGRKWYKKDIL